MDFAVQTSKLAYKLPRNQIIYEYTKQLIRSSSSIGANLEEADGSLSKKEFVNKMAISRREARESKYWLTLIMRSDIVKDTHRNNEINLLIREANEILLILSSIINKVKKG